MTPLILFIIFCFLVLIRYIVWPNNSEPTMNTKHTPITTNSSKPLTNRSADIDARKVECNDGSIICVDMGTIMQAMESIAIIETTANLDTLISRFDFLKIKLSDICSAYKDDMVGYMVAKTGAMIWYKQSYYDKDISKHMEAIISHPENELRDFYSHSIVHCLSAFCDKMEKEMHTLKTDKAKDRRRCKVVECLTQCVTELNQNGIPEYINQIPAIVERFDIHISLNRASEMDVDEVPKDYVHRVN